MTTYPCDIFGKGIAMMNCLDGWLPRRSPAPGSCPDANSFSVMFANTRGEAPALSSTVTPIHHVVQRETLVPRRDFKELINESRRLRFCAYDAKWSLEDKIAIYTLWPTNLVEIQLQNSLFSPVSWFYLCMQLRSGFVPLFSRRDLHVSMLGRKFNAALQFKSFDH